MAVVCQLGAEFSGVGYQQTQTYTLTHLSQHLILVVRSKLYLATPIFPQVFDHFSSYLKTSYLKIVLDIIIRIIFIEKLMKIDSSYHHTNIQLHNAVSSQHTLRLKDKKWPKCIYLHKSVPSFCVIDQQTYTKHTDYFTFILVQIKDVSLIIQPSSTQLPICLFPGAACSTLGEQHRSRASIIFVGRAKYSRLKWRNGAEIVYYIKSVDFADKILIGSFTVPRLTSF